MFKTCFKCGEMKDIDSFSLHSKMKDGHLGKCKQCAIEYSRGHRARNPELYTEFEKQRRSSPERKEQAASYLKAYRKKHPKRYSCNQKLVRAVKSGKVLKEVCFICGDPDSVGHHPDYDQPLSVTWLCRVHHRELHAAAS